MHLAAEGTATTRDMQTKPTPPSSHGPEGDDLLRRAPMAYLWNQLGSLWLYAASFLLFFVLTHTLGRDGFGYYSAALTVFNTAVYLAAFGLEDAATVFLPRTLAKEGRAATWSLMRRILIARVICSLIIGVGIVLIIPPFAYLIGMTHLPAAARLAGLPRLPGLDVLAVPVVVYAAGMGMMNSLAAIFTSIMRTRLTLVIGGLSQLANIGGILIMARLGLGVGGVLWALGIVTWLTALAYFAFLAPFWRAPRTQPTEPKFAPVLQLGWSAWLVNLIPGALLKQSAVSLLQYFSLGSIAIGYFTAAFQLTHGAAFLLIAGLGGVGQAAMAASYAGENKKALGFAWRAVSKVQMLLAVPLLAFSFIHANAIAVVLLGSQFAAVGPLMQVFLVFNILQRVAGGGSHQAALYVLGYQRLALWSQYGGLLVTLILGAILVPMKGSLGGPAGALIAVGVGQVGVEMVQLALAWRFLKRRYPLRFGFRVCLALIPPMVLAALWHPSVAIHLPGHIGPVPISSKLVDLIISVLAFAVVLIASLAIAKPIEHEDVELLSEVNPRLRPILSPFAGGPPSQIAPSSAASARQRPQHTLPQIAHDRDDTDKRAAIDRKTRKRTPDEQ
jgi:O-antigen/teichoic acid export membrane protein